MLRKKYSQLKFILFLLKTKGFRYTHNRIWHGLYRSTGWLGTFVFVRLFPLFYKMQPRLVEIEVTTRCHLRCVMCENVYWTEKGVDMTLEQFKGIVDQFNKLKWIGLTGIGTAFLNKDFMKMLRYIKEKDPAIQIELFDTFHLIDEDKAKELIDIGVDFMFASIDGATKETYEKIRVGSNFERVISNIETLLRLKKETNSYFPVLAFHYIISRDNLHEVPAFVDLVAQRFGPENAHHIFFTGILHEFDAIKNIVVGIPDDIVEAACKKGAEYGIPISWNKNIPSEKLPFRECTAWIEPFIFVDGTVIQCCASNEGNRRSYQKEHSFGNVFKQDFKEIWNSEKYINFRKAINANSVPPQCKYCSVRDLSSGRTLG